MSSDTREQEDEGGNFMSSDLRGECAAILEESLAAAKKGVEGAEEDILIQVYLRQVHRFSEKSTCTYCY
jgi:hypothetical protein